MFVHIMVLTDMKWPQILQNMVKEHQSPIRILGSPSTKANSCRVCECVKKKLNREMTLSGI